MATDEVLGPRKTMFVLVIVVGCFAVLWPRILSPIILGPNREQLKPNQFDREAGCCEVIFEPDVAMLELVNEVCSSAIGKQSIAECRKAVNDTCGVDIAGLVKQKENVGKTTKMLVEAMKNSNSSCLRDNFGVQIYSLMEHFQINSWSLPDNLKQERPPIRAGPHPAMRERGRAIPPAAPPPAQTTTLPPHIRVRSPLSVYYALDTKPPPIPGMRPPLGSPGGPVQAPRSAMGFLMPIYTICMIMFFVYTMSKFVFKRLGTCEDLEPDPVFRRRVFGDESRSTPDKIVVSAISGLVAEVEQQMQTSYAQSQQRQEARNSTRPYTNGSVVSNTSPVQIVTDEYKEPKECIPETITEEDFSSEIKEVVDPPKDLEVGNGYRDLIVDNKVTKEGLETKESLNDPYSLELTKENDVNIDKTTVEPNDNLSTLDKEDICETEHTEKPDLIEHTEVKERERNEIITESDTLSAEFINEERKVLEKTEEREYEPAVKVLEEVIRENSPTEDNVDEKESSSVKVVGMEVTADGGEWSHKEQRQKTTPQRPHEAEEVKSIFLETEIPQQARVLVADFAEDRAESPAPAKNAPLVVSGKITLSLIQDAPRETPERDAESTVDDFTTASALTQPAEKQDDLSDEEIEEVEEIEEIEVEEVEEEVEEIDEEVEEEVEDEEVEENETERPTK